MTSQANSGTLPQFPLVIPTQTTAPTARLSVRAPSGQIVQQWLIKGKKYTLGSASDCPLRCDLPGIAPYHALIVLGARQSFLRALAPRVTRDGTSVTEILLVGDVGQFEIAGHQFVLTRGVGQSSQSAEAKQRMRFALARPLSPNAKVSPSVVTSSSDNSSSLRPLSQADPDRSTPQWVSELVREAIAPLEQRLGEVAGPIVQLQQEATERKKARQRKKSQRLAFGSGADQTQDVTPLPTQASTPDAQPNVTEEVASELREQIATVTVRQSAAMEVITERISDVNQQLSTIERLVTSEAPTPLPELESVHSQVDAQNASIQQLQQGFVAVTDALRDLNESRGREADNDRQWKSDVHDKLELLERSLTDLHQQSHDAAVGMSAQELKQYSHQLAESQSVLAAAVQENDLNLADLESGDAQSSVFQSDWVSANQLDESLAADVSILQSFPQTQWSDALPVALPNAPAALPKTQTPDANEMIADQQPSIDVAGTPTTAPTAEENLDVNWAVDAPPTDASFEATSQWDLPAGDLPADAEEQNRDPESDSNNDLRGFIASQQQLAASDSLADAEADSPWNLDPQSPLESIPAPVQPPELVNSAQETAADDATTNDTDADDAPSKDTDTQESDAPNQLNNSPWLEDEFPTTFADPQSSPSEALDEPSSGNPQWSESEFSAQSSWGTGEDSATEFASLETDAPASLPTTDEFETSGPSANDQPQDAFSFSGLDNIPGPELGDDPDNGFPSDGAEAVESSLPSWWNDDQESTQATGGGEDSSDDPASADVEVAAATEEQLQAADAQPGETLEAQDLSELLPATEEENSARPDDLEPNPAERATETPELDAASEGDNGIAFNHFETSQSSLAFGAEEGEEAGTEGLAQSDEGAVEVSLPSEDSSFAAASQDHEGEDAFFGLGQTPASEDVAEAPSAEEPELATGLQSASLLEHFTDQSKTSSPQPQSGTLDAEQESGDGSLLDQRMDESLSGVEMAVDSELGQTFQTGEDVEQDSSDQEEGEESVEAYMQRLLARMRGDEGGEEPVAAKPAAVNPKPSQPIASQQEPASAEGPNHGNSAEADNRGSGENSLAASNSATVAAPNNAAGETATNVAGNPSVSGTDPYAPSPSASEEELDGLGLSPEQIAVLHEKEQIAANKRKSSQNPGQLAAMRELANSSARTAISRSNRRRAVTSVGVKAGVAFTGLAVAIILLVMNGLSLNIGLIATFAAGLVAAIWGYDTYTTLRQFKAPASAAAPEEQPAASTDQVAASEKQGQ